MAWHPGLCAGRVRCPTLFVVSPRDEMPGASPAVARDAYEKLAGPKEWTEIDGGHFGLLYHPSEEFEKASSAQAHFLSAHLRACANRRVAYVSRSCQKSVQSLRGMSCAKCCPPIGAASKTGPKAGLGMNAIRKRAQVERTSENTPSTHFAE